MPWWFPSRPAAPPPPAPIRDGDSAPRPANARHRRAAAPTSAPGPAAPRRPILAALGAAMVAAAAYGVGTAATALHGGGTAPAATAEDIDPSAERFGDFVGRPARATAPPVRMRAPSAAPQRRPPAPEAEAPAAVPPPDAPQAPAPTAPDGAPDAPVPPPELPTRLPPNHPPEEFAPDSAREALELWQRLHERHGGG
ncbi:hypothetical protein FZ103_23025 [Streptomonospora sp. PA3]|uniref:hypothetical protein n=1 Tax=Streptomonospora sp. PA3 TaxID=2607326 RepID=UPI0012DFD694|nr:hypothetical protein [Streptomonospora sp. PA3]MUL44001.1 hypothetical protein [Streptomonospora sp. PA3]